MSMSELEKKVRLHGLRGLLRILAAVIVIGFGLATLSGVWTAYEKRGIGFTYCLSTECIDYAWQMFQGSVTIMDISAKVAVWIATVGGIVIALLNYINTTAATALGNHVSHSRIFYDYVMSEIEKRDRIRASNVDIFKIYSLAFENSRDGGMDVSDDYRQKVGAVAMVVEESNRLMMAASPDGFRFRDHQHRLISALGHLGVHLTTQPRVDFFEIESEVFDLINAINHVFCADKEIPLLPQRQYR